MPTINLDRSLDGLMAIAIERLRTTTLSGETPGSVTRLLLARVNEVAKDFYDVLKLAHAQAFASSATAENLDAIGALFSCTRLDNESDDNYRYRITKQTASIASANATAVRLAVLSVPGVIDCILKPYTHGTGSGSIFVITSDPYPSEAFLAQVQAKVDDIIAFGNKAVVAAPKPVPVELGVKLIFSKKAKTSDSTLVVGQARQLLKDYLARKMPGDPIVINEINAKLMDMNNDIYDIQIYKMTVNGKPALLVNQETRWDERFVESTKPDAVVVS